MKTKILNIPAAEYHKVKALSNSGISKMLDCPAKFKAWLDSEGVKQSEATLLGSAFHSLVLEPESFKAQYHVMKNSGSTKEGKAEKAEAEKSGLTILTQSQYEESVNLSKGLLKHEGIKKLLSNKRRQTEISIFWEEEIEGQIIPCKARLDALIELAKYGNLILDCKSMRSLSTGSLPKTIAEWGYHRQGWWYLRALNQAGLPVNGFFLAAVEKSPPYLSALIEIEPKAIEQGGRECLRALGLYAKSLKTGHWLGYPENVISINLPDWFYRKEAQHNDTTEQFAI